MPAYEYECPQGHRQTEYRAVVHRRDLTKCTECGMRMELAISTPATPVLNPARPVKPLGNHHKN